MNLWFVVENILFYSYFISVNNLIYCAASEWVLHDENLYYMQIEGVMTYSQANSFCQSKNMPGAIEAADENYLKGNIHSIFRQNNESTLSFWVIGDLNLKKKNYQMYKGNTCLKFTKDEVIPSRACNTYLGTICKVKIFGGHLRFKNGTECTLGITEVNQYCNPQSKSYDDILDFCLIKHFFVP